MKDFGVLIASTAAVILVIAPGSRVQKVIQSQDFLNRPAINVNLKDTTARDALLEALINAGTPGGIVIPEHCGALPRHSLKPANPSLRALLDAIVSAEPGYTWEVRNGVVNLVSHDGRSPFLQTIVPKLEINKAPAIRDALNELLKIPVVQEQAQRDLGSRLMQGFAYGYGPKATGPSEAKELSLRATEITVREALNAIARQHGSAVWVLSEYQCNGRKIYSLDFAAK